MAFSVVLPVPRGTSTLPFTDKDEYDVSPGGVLSITIGRASGARHHFPPGQWIEVAEGADPISG